MPIPVIYAGTPDFAVPALQALIDDPAYKVIAVYTQPDRPAGRGRSEQQSPVKQLALKHSIPVEQPVNFKAADDIAQLQTYPADLMVVAAYGLLLPQQVLDWPRVACINIHASLLPRWRGAAPIQRAIEAGDTETGIGIMKMELSLDTGPVYLTRKIPILENETGGSLHDKLAGLGATSLMQSLPGILDGSITPEPQNSSLTCYARKLSKSDGELDWSRPATELHNRIRAFNPWPVAYTQLDGKTIRIWEACVTQEDNTDQTAGTVTDEDSHGIQVQAAQGVLNVTRLQLPGKKAISAREFLNANSLLGKKLGR